MTEQQPFPLTLKAIIPRFLPQLEAEGRLTAHQRKILARLAACRTLEMGMHQRICDACGEGVWQYNSCGDRHCPQCQGAQQQAWVHKHLAELPAVGYHHLVFTIPDTLHALMRMNQKVLYNLLFAAAAATLKTFAQDPRHLGATPGMLGVLHTWGQTLNYHPHLHFLVTAGGVTPQGTWQAGQHGAAFLFPVRALSRVFRGKFLALLKKAFTRNKLVFPGQLAEFQDPRRFAFLTKTLASKLFRVHSSPATGNGENVLRYLAAYMTRTALSNRRLVQADAQSVAFSYKAYRQDGKRKVCRLSGSTFLARFASHILPKGFRRVRTFGLFASAHRKPKLAQLRQTCGPLLAPADLPAPFQPPCPVCLQGSLRFVQLLRPEELARLPSPPTPWDDTS